jgi:prepilin-type N-terminal cleavage/methylation domain-containing protein
MIAAKETGAKRGRPGQGQRRQLGFSLVELMMVVFMIGILSSLIGTAYMRNLKRSRTTEAVGHLQKMWSGAISYYEADHALGGGQMANKQFPGDCDSFVLAEADCCPPVNPSGHCQGNDPVYTQDPWKSLMFNISDQHLYVPHYGACPDPTKNLWIEAWGDLDCDGTHSVFTRRANVGPGGDVEGYLTPAVVNEIE